MTNIPTWPLEVVINTRYEEGKLMEPPECFIRQVGTDKVVADMVDPEYASSFSAVLDLLAAVEPVRYIALADMSVAYLEQITKRIREAIAKAEGRS